MNLIEHFQVVLLFLAVGTGMIVVPMIALTLVRPHKPSVAKLMPYECGMEPVGDAQVCFDMRFYTDALVFLIFEVETVFLFPWAIVFKDMGAIALVEGLIFISILFLGLIYVWAKGDLDWVKSTAASRGTPRKEGVAPALPSFQTGPASRRPTPEPLVVAASAGDET